MRKHPHAHHPNTDTHTPQPLDMILEEDVEGAEVEPEIEEDVSEVEDNTGFDSDV